MSIEPVEPVGVASIEFGDMTAPDRLFKLMLHFAAACSTAEELGYRVVIHEFRDQCDGVAGFQADASRAPAERDAATTGPAGDATR